MHVPDQAVDPQTQTTRLACILVGPQVLRSAIGIVDRGHSGPSHHPGNQLHTLAIIFSGKSGRDDVFKKIGGLFLQLAGGAAPVVTVDVSSWGVGGIFADSCYGEGLRIDVSGVSTAMTDEDRMVRSGDIQIFSVQRPPKPAPR